MNLQTTTGQSCRDCGAPLDQSSSETLCGNCVGNRANAADAGGEPSPLTSRYTAEEMKDLSTLGANPYASPLDPDNPHWGIPAGVGTLLFSVAAILFLPLLSVLIAIIIEMASGGPKDSQAFGRWLAEWLETPRGALFQVVPIIPAHLLTLGFCWAVVTGMGKRPFLQSLGWEWDIGDRLRKAAPTIAAIALSLFALLITSGLVQVVGAVWGNSPLGLGAKAAIAALMLAGTAGVIRTVFTIFRESAGRVATVLAKASLILGVLVGVYLVLVILDRLLPPSQQTAFDKLLRSSREVRIVVAILAVLTAPVVEEFVYRGVLFSSLKRKMGVRASIALVTFIFAAIHFPQYWGAWASMAGLTFLSFVLTLIRARTGSIFPCVVIHTLFNSLGAIEILRRGGTG